MNFQTIVIIYLSNNHIKFNVDTSNYVNENNPCVKKNIKNNYKRNYISSSFKANKALLQKENNVTCIYAINERHRLLNIGYIKK